MLKNTLTKTINDINQAPIEYLGSPKKNKKEKCINIREKDKILILISSFKLKMKNKFNKIIKNHIS